MNRSRDHVYKVPREGGRGAAPDHRGSVAEAPWWGKGRTPRADMGAERVLAVLACLERADVHAWLDGGWGVDGLLCRQTRPHDDVDMVVPRSELARLRVALGGLGYLVADEAAVSPDDPEAFEYLVDAHGHQVDVHPVCLGPEGNGVYHSATGEAWVIPAAGFLGEGRILHRDVACLSAEVLLQGHATGYALDAAHRADVMALAEGFGLPVPAFRSLDDAPEAPPDPGPDSPR